MGKRLTAVDVFLAELCEHVVHVDLRQQLVSHCHLLLYLHLWLIFGCVLRFEFVHESDSAVSD